MGKGFISIIIYVVLLHFCNLPSTLAEQMWEEPDITWPDIRDLHLRIVSQFGLNLQIEWTVYAPDTCFEMVARLNGGLYNTSQTKSSKEAKLEFIIIGSDSDFQLEVTIKTRFSPEGIRATRSFTTRKISSKSTALKTGTQGQQTFTVATKFGENDQLIGVLVKDGVCAAVVYNTGTQFANYSIEATMAQSSTILPAIAMSAEMAVVEGNVSFTLPASFLESVGSFTPEVYNVTGERMLVWPPQNVSAKMQLEPRKEASIRLSFRPSVTYPDLIRDLNVEFYTAPDMIGVPFENIRLSAGTNFTLPTLIETQKSRANVFNSDLSKKLKLGTTYYIKMYTNIASTSYTKAKMILPDIDPTELSFVKAEPAKTGGIKFSWGPPYVTEPRIVRFELRADGGGQSIKKEAGPDAREFNLTDINAYTEYQTFITVIYDASSETPHRQYLTGKVLTVATAPSPPTNVKVQQTGSTNVQVTWNAPERANGILQPYDIDCYNPSNRSWSLGSVRSATNETLSADLKNLPANAEVQCLVEASNQKSPFDEGGETKSNLSEVFKTWPGVMSQLIGVGAEAVEVDKAQVTWRTPEKIPGICGGYQVNLTSQVSQLTTSLSVDCSTFSATFLTSGSYVMYTAVVSGWIEPNELGQGGGLNQPSYPKYFTTWPGKPSPPELVALKTVNATAVQLTWQEPAFPNGRIKSYLVSLRLAPSGAWDLEKRVSSHPRTHTFGGLKPFTQVFAAVTAETEPTSASQGGGLGTSSDVVSAWTMEAAPEQVTGLKCSQASGVAPEISCQWTAPHVTNGIVRDYIVTVKEINGETVLFQSAVKENQVVIAKDIKFYQSYTVSVAAETVEIGPAVSVEITLNLIDPPVVGEDEDEGLSSGTIAGIAVGIIAILGITGVVTFFLVHQKSGVHKLEAEIGQALDYSEYVLHKQTLVTEALA